MIYIDICRDICRYPLDNLIRSDRTDFRQRIAGDAGWGMTTEAFPITPMPARSLKMGGFT